MSEPAVIIATDGCTGFPDHVAGLDLTQCCSIHDDGGRDGALIDCLIDLNPTSGVWGFVVIVCVLLMYIGRPVYNLLQRWGILPKTKGSNF